MFCQKDFFKPRLSEPCRLNLRIVQNANKIRSRFDFEVFVKERENLADIVRTYDSLNFELRL